MKIDQLTAHPDWTFSVITDDGRVGRFDVRPYLQYEAFEALTDIAKFMKLKNGGYFVEWECGADLSADTIEAKMAATPATGANNNNPRCAAVRALSVLPQFRQRPSGPNFEGT